MKSVLTFALVTAIAPFASAITITGNGGPNFVDAGSFAAGTVLHLTGTGTVDLVGGGYLVDPNGALAATPTDPIYAYTAAGSAYPTTFGGDGINRFVGGGANFDAYAYSINYSQAPFANAEEFAFGYAGAKTTDTTDPNAIRLGSLIGTFSTSPTRADWFLIGTGTTITSPGGTLLVTVNEGYHQNNTGAFNLNVQAVPEPTSFAALALGGFGLLRRRVRGSKKAS